MFTVRTADEVQAAEFPEARDELDPEMITIARAIIQRRAGAFDPTTFRDPRDEALRRLADAKLKGEPIAPPPKQQAEPVADLMSALKKSLAQEGGRTVAKPKAARDRRQPSLLLPVAGKGRSASRSARVPSKRQKNV